jgi:hypothetical protein
LRRLDEGGLYTLQRLAQVIGHVSAYDLLVMQRLKQKLQQMGSSVEVVIGTIEELRSNLGDDDANDAQNESGNGENKDAQELQRTAEQKAQLVKLVGQLNEREEDNMRRIEEYDRKQQEAEAAAAGAGEREGEGACAAEAASVESEPSA